MSRIDDLAAAYARFVRLPYVGTAGSVSSETIRKYIEAQKGR
jgi:hypothetical protein